MRGGKFASGAGECHARGLRQERRSSGQKEVLMMRVGFEPTPVRTRSLVWRLRPLGHLTM